jgi:hypothetical protein
MQTTQPAAAAQATARQYGVFDKQTGQQVGKPYSSGARARARRDVLDNQYGAYRYTVRPL